MTKYHIVTATILFLLFLHLFQGAAQFMPSFGLPSYGVSRPGFLNPRIPPRVEPYSPYNRWPPMAPIYPTYTYQPQYYRPRPPSPARQCRHAGACRELDHGTTLASNWKIETTTTPIPTTII